MAGQDSQADRGLLSRRDPDESKNARVRPPMDDRQLSEVLVESHKHTVIPSRLLQDLLVAGISSPIAGPEHASCPALASGSLAPPQTHASRRTLTSQWA